MTDEHTELLAKPKEVDIVAIERELTALWKNASGVTVDGQDSPVLRACTLNFIVATENESELEPLADLVGEVTIEHPARIFLVAATRDELPKLDAWVSARCSLPVPGGKQVCCEQINLVAGGSEVAKVPSIITSLLVSDIPTVLLWKPTLDANDPELHALIPVVDRVLIDTSENPAPEAGMLAWRQFLGQHAARTTFGDLAWTHLTPWRSVVANAFNPPDMRQRLREINSLIIEYSSTTSPRHSGLSQSFLLLSWFSLKLEWALLKTLQKAGEEYAATFRCGENTITVRLVPVAAKHVMPGGIESISIHTTPGVTLKFSTTGREQCLRYAKHDGASSSDEVLTLKSDKSEAMLVALELEVVTRDAGYEAVLKKFSDLYQPV